MEFTAWLTLGIFSATILVVITGIIEWGWRFFCGAVAHRESARIDLRDSGFNPIGSTSLGLVLD